jgi:hypothetical protein
LQTGSAFAGRYAHEDLLELKKVIDDATNMTHAAELESFRAAINRNDDNRDRSSLRAVIGRLKSPGFDRALFEVRDKLETAAS